MSVTWNLQSWLRGRLVGIRQRQRRRARRSWLPVEQLEARVVPTTTIPAPGGITGMTFIDANGNGTKQASEIVVKGVTVRLTGTSNANDQVNARTKTDQDGNFSFTLVPAGTYQLRAISSTAITGGASMTVVVGSSLVSKNLAVGTVAASSLSLRSFMNSSVSGNTAASFAFLKPGVGQTTGINYAPTLRGGQQPADIVVAKNASPTTIDLTGVFDDPNIVTSQVQIRTNGGNINVNLYDKAAPQTVQNFYNYAKSGAYNNAIFHRLASGFVLQGGGFKFNPKDTSTNPATAASITAIPTDSAVKNEFDGVNRSNVAGTIAMAKIGSDPNSATNQFFFNLADNHTNLDNQNGGFTVFGKVLTSDDMAVVNSLSDTSTTSPIKVTDQSTATSITNASVKSALNQLPLKGYKGTTATFPTDATASNFELIRGVTTVVRDEALTYKTISNTDPAIVTPSIKHHRLTLTYKAGAVGNADIKVRATDKHGQTFDVTFHVRVSAPSVTALTLTPANPQPKSIISATAAVTDPNSLTANLTYVWKVNGTMVKTTDPTTSVADTLDLNGLATPVNVGDVVSVEVTPSDTVATGSTRIESKTIVANSAPATTVSISPASPTTTTTLTATASPTDANGDPISLTYVWKVNDDIKRTITKSGTTDTLVLGSDAFANSGDIVSVQVTPSDGQLTGTAATDSETVT